MSRPESEAYKSNNLEKEEQENGNLDLVEYDKLLKRQYNMGYYYYHQAEKEIFLGEKLDYVSEDMKGNYGINRPMDEEKYSQFTEDQGNKEEGIQYSYQTFSLDLSDYN
ncbi:hypothetical protein O181_012531 [Austropuccinia psidii MF-1]|uniref:Uncharacterized protein n=1 Tax=Austropuccinia psidii MF-1 TaxID=1389203 RepID=A0A9Q3BUS7_9BASI|nr:hypothetical protein [Austropuccinia psidii MF-1]